MEYNIINTYIGFLKREYLEFFKILLKEKYQKKLCESFLNRYLDVRYFHETNYPKEKDIINRLNKELIDVYDSLKNENKEDLKNIVALFGYITYFDDINDVIEDMFLIDTLVDDDSIKINHSNETKEELKSWYYNLKNGKEKFQHAVDSKQFFLMDKSVYRKTYLLTLNHNVKISSLYSEYAVEKAFNSGLINEDKLIIAFIMGSKRVLDNAIKLDFSRYYLFDLPRSIYLKSKKFNKLFQIINNPLAKKQIVIRITYSDYLEYKKIIDEKINEGYLFGLIIDSKFEGNIDEFILFPYVFIHNENEYFDMIMNEKNNISSKVVRI